MIIKKRFKEKRPIIGRGWRISGAHDQVYAHKFQGNPVKILALKKSINAKELENSKMDEKLFFKNGPIIKIPKPKKTPRNKGKPIREIGIKNLKFSSNVRECEIQCVPARKNPIPNKYPIRNMFKRYGFFLYVFLDFFWT